MTIEQVIAEKLRRTPLMSVLTDGQFQSALSKSQKFEFVLGDSIDSGAGQSPVLWLLLSGKARLASQTNSGDGTLLMLNECGSFWSSELSKRAGVESPILIASDKTSLIKIDESSLQELFADSQSFNEAMSREARVLRSFLRLRLTPRFRNLDFWRFRPILSQGACHQFGAADKFEGGGTSNGLSIILDGTVSSKVDGRETLLKQGDWFSRGRLFPFKDASLAHETALDAGELFHISESAYTNIRQLSPELISQMDSLLLDSVASEAADSDVIAHLSPADQAPPEEAAAIAEKNEPLVPKLRRHLKQYPMVYQHSELECGITSLHMICLFYGKKVSLTHLRELCEIGRSGSSMLDLAEAAEQLGFICRGLRTTYAGLSKLRLPLILHWANNHYVVLYEVHATHALIGDPGQGLMTVPVDKFRKEFTEYCLELSPTVRWFDQNLKATPMWSTLAPIVKPHQALIRDIVICSLVYQLLLLVSPVFTQIIIDQVIVHQDLDTLNILLLGMLLLSVFQAAMSYLRQFFLAFLALKTDQELFTELFKRLFSLPLEYFNRHSTGETLTRFAESAGVVQFLTGMGAITLLDVAMALVFLLVVFFYSIPFGIGALLYVAVLVTFLLLYSPVVKRLSQRSYDKQIAAESFLVEAIRGVEKVKSAAADNRTRWKWDALFLEKLNIKFQESITVSMASAIVRFLQLGGQIFFLWLGAHMVIARELTLGQMMSLSMLISMIAQSFIRLADLVQSFQTVNVAVERLVEVLHEKPEEQDPLSKIHVSGVQGHLKFEKVCYRYAGGDSKNALNNISFEAKPGQMIGIVGRSGSGKTTLTRLIQGLYLPSEGRITVDGNDLSKILLSTYRHRIGVVSQTEYYFRGTVRENIAFYKPDATMQEIIDACTIAGVNEFITALPSGYETVLNEGAENFSGGERQCMAIARCIVHKPNILIFDEATSAMDSDTEQRIQECMEKLRNQSTMFVVAHRLSTVRSADLILVVDRGQLVESGTHESLMQQKGMYYFLCKKQALA